MQKKSRLKTASGFESRAIAEAFENFYYDWYLKRVPPFMLLFGGVLCILSALYMIIGFDFTEVGEEAAFLALIDGLVGALLLLVYLYLKSLISEHSRTGRRTSADFFASGLIVIYSIIIATAPQMPIRPVIFVFGVMSLLLVPRLKPWRLLITAAMGMVVFILVDIAVGSDPMQIAYSTVDAAAAVILAYVLSIIGYANRVEAFTSNYKLSIINTALKAESELDPLTGLVNRRRSDAVFAHEWERAKRNKEKLSIVLIDIDQLKRYNDTYGHAVGDECILAVADALKSCVKRGSDVITRCASDIASRYGGDEFMLLLPDTDVEGAFKVAQSVMSGVRGSNIGGSPGALPAVTVSVGIASALPAASEDMKRLFERADKALYEAKHSGRDSIRIGD